MDTSTCYWCIASKLKVPLNFMEWTKRFFVGGSISFQSALTLAVLQWQKCLLDIGGTTIQDVIPFAPMEPGVHTMTNELILQISCNIFLAFKLILMMRSGHNVLKQNHMVFAYFPWYFTRRPAWKPRPRRGSGFHAGSPILSHAVCKFSNRYKQIFCYCLSALPGDI